MVAQSGPRLHHADQAHDRAVRREQALLNEEIITSEFGQIGTQFDGFTHQAIDKKLYNCVDMDEVSSRFGYTKMGIEKVGTLMTRGVLLDIAALKGVEILPNGYEITPQDLQEALRRQNLTIQRGDAVLIYNRLVEALGRRQQALHQRLPGPRHRSGAVADQPGPDAARRRQLAGRGRAQSRPAAQPRCTTSP